MSVSRVFMALRFYSSYIGMLNGMLTYIHVNCRLCFYDIELTNLVIDFLNTLIIYLHTLITFMN